MGEEKSPELERAYEELQRARNMLVQAEKMSVVGKLAGGIAHELKNPLGIIIQGVNYLEGKIARDDEKQREILDMIKEAVRRADKILCRFLNFSSFARLDQKPRGLNSVVESALDLALKQLPVRDVRVTKDFAGNLPPAMIDEDQMTQALINIFVNALEAMPEGGDLTMRSSAKVLAELAIGVGRRATDYFRVGDTVLVCEIEDAGEGIPRDEISKVFDPYFTSKPVGRGLGLGLTIARSVIQRHEGLVEIESVEGRGTKVVITLPVARDG